MDRNYRNGKVYCIRNTVNDEVYVGSTTQRLSKRMAKHREDFKNEKYKSNKLYLQMKEHGNDNFYIELIEECPVENIEQLRKKEGEYIRQLGTLNTAIAGRKKPEWIGENKEHLKNYQANHYQENKEKHQENMKRYREEHKEEIRAKKAEPITCECGSTFRRSDKGQHLRTKKHQEFINNK